MGSGSVQTPLCVSIVLCWRLTSKWSNLTLYSLLHMEKREFICFCVVFFTFFEDVYVFKGICTSGKESNVILRLKTNVKRSEKWKLSEPTVLPLLSSTEKVKNTNIWVIGMQNMATKIWSVQFKHILFWTSFCFSFMPFWQVVPWRPFQSATYPVSNVGEMS